MKQYAILAVMFCCFAAYAQKPQLPPMLVNFETDLRGEMIELTKWAQDSKLHNLNDSEAKEPAVVIDEVRADFLEVPKVGPNETRVFNYRMYYKRVHMVEDKGVESFNKIYLPVQSEIELVDLRARTMSASGKISKEFGEDDMKLIEEDGNKYLILALDGAEKGGEVEYFFIVRKSLSEYGDINIQGGTFIRNYSYTMRVPENVEYLFKGYNNCPKVQDEHVGDYNKYTLTVSNVPVLNKEIFQSYDAELMRLEYLLGYTKSQGRVRYNTYADFAKNVLDNIMKDKDKSEKEIKKLSKKLKLEELSSEEDKIRTIENWVKSNIVFNENIGFNSMKEVLKNKFTGERGLIRLYMFMFENNKIKYQLWATCDKDDKELDENFESFNFLQDYYFYFPNTKKYLDFKNLAWRVGLPPSAILGQKAVQIKTVDLGDGIITSKYSVGMAETPGCKATNDILSLELGFDGSLSKATVKYHNEMGGYQNYIKAVYSLVHDETERKKLLEEQVKRVSEDAVISSVSAQNSDINDLQSGDKPIVIDAELTTSKLMETAGDKVILKVGALIGEQSELYSEKPRQTRIVNSYPHMYTRTITIAIPSGYNLKGLEKLVINKVHQNGNDSIGFISNYTLNGNKLVINCTEYYECLNWPIEKYEQYREVINAAADFNKISLIFDPEK